MVMGTLLDSLNTWLKQAMLDDESVLLMGEDILDPYGGAFKVTRNLSNIYPDRVLTTPISEAGMVGVAIGLALGGFRPVVEIMFGDFSTLVADQVINHLSKFSSMYGDVFPGTVIIRTPMGGRRGYGPTHSQTIERIYLGVPSLKVIAPCHFAGGAGELLYRAILKQKAPVFFVENKLQYLLGMLDQGGTGDVAVEQIEEGSENLFPVYRARVRGAPEAEVTIITYGYMSELAREAMVELAYQKEIFLDLLVFTQLSPLDIPKQAQSYLENRDLLILEEGTRGWGWGAEVLARLSDDNQLYRRAKRLAARESIIPASPELERKVLPQVEDIISAILTMRGGG